MIINEKKLQLYIENNLNVLFEGERGVGKTETIRKAFAQYGYRVKYFSASTMDPWTDLVGVPTTVTRNDGKEVLRMVMPEDFVDDKFDVIFIDELNRAPKKVKDALMEIIQFKTINGKPYNIKMVWGAMNPHKENDSSLGQDYDVEPLDPALLDRFHIKIKFPYKVDNDYFKDNFGTDGTVFAQWWKNQPENIQHEISPRRLAYAAQYYSKGVDVEDIINCGNISKLKEMLSSANQLAVLEQDMKQGIISASSKAILQKNYSETLQHFIVGKKEFNFFCNELSDEWLSKECLKQNKVFEYLVNFSQDKTNTNYQKSHDILQGVISINKKSSFVRQNFEKISHLLPPQTIENSTTLPPIDKPYVTKSNAQTRFIKSHIITDWYEPGGKIIASTLISKFVNYSKFNFMNSALPNDALEKHHILDLISFHYAAMISFFKVTNKASDISIINQL